MNKIKAYLKGAMPTAIVCAVMFAVLMIAYNKNLELRKRLGASA